MNPTVVKSVARPLDKNLLQQRPLGNSVSASALLTPLSFSSSVDNSRKDNHSHSVERPSVRDLKSCYEKPFTPTRQSDQFPSPKLIPRIPSNINNSRSNIEQRDLPNGFDSSQRFSHINSQQSETQNSFNDSLEGGPLRLSSESDPSKRSSPRRTSFHSERHKLNNLGHNQERTKNISHPDLNGDVQSPLRSQDNHKHDSYAPSLPFPRTKVDPNLPFWSTALTQASHSGAPRLAQAYHSGAPRLTQVYYSEEPRLT